MLHSQKRHLWLLRPVTVNKNQQHLIAQGYQLKTHWPKLKTNKRFNAAPRCQFIAKCLWASGHQEQVRQTGNHSELETSLLRCPKIIFVYCKHSSSKQQGQPTKQHGQLKHNHCKSKSKQETNRPSSKKRKPIWFSRLAQAHISDISIPKMDLNRRAIGLFSCNVGKDGWKANQKARKRAKTLLIWSISSKSGLYGQLDLCHPFASPQMLKVWVREQIPESKR